MREKCKRLPLTPTLSHKGRGGSGRKKGEIKGRIGCVTTVLNGLPLSPCQAYKALRPLHPFALLESALPNPVTGRQSFLGLGPVPLFQCKNEIASSSRNSGTPRNDLATLQFALDRWQSRWQTAESGAYGCVFMIFSYEWKNVLESLPQRANDDLGFPDAMLFACDDLVVWDHAANSVTIHSSHADDLASRDRAFQRNREIRTRLEKFEDRNAADSKIKVDRTEPRIFPLNWSANMTRSEFLTKVEKIKQYIAAGDIYQANLSQRFDTQRHVDGLSLYETLCRINPSPFAGYMSVDGWELISCSPERLVRKIGSRLETRPIAGTRPRGNTIANDGNLEKDLVLSPKERAEHIMLVDLERNDLGRVCEKGSVCVDEMMCVEKYSHVQHIVSNVRGTLRRDVPFTDILRAVFPGGTITGVPKIRCMEILDELEPTARGPYTGSFGYLDAHGDFDLNIAIRTILKRGDSLAIQVGAGIVADSDPAAEYQETLDKAKAMALAVERGSDKIKEFRSQESE